MRTMKLRCPYCKSVFPASIENRCPKCGKAFLGPASSEQRKPASVSVADIRQARAARPAQTPVSLLLRRPVQIVIAVVILLAVGLALIHLVNTPPPPDERDKIHLAELNIETLCAALDLVRSHAGRYPTTREGLVSLIHDPGMTNWQGPYIYELKPDPWGNAFRLTSDTEEFTISSAGPDGSFGTADDLIVASGATSTPSPQLYRATIQPPPSGSR